MCIYYIETCLEGHECALVYTKACNYANNCRPLRYCDIEEVKMGNIRKSRTAKQYCEPCEVEKQINAQEDAVEAAAVDNEEDEEEEVEEIEPMIVAKKEETYEQSNEKEETDELDQCTVTQSVRSQALAAVRRGRSTGRGLKSSLPAKNTPAKRGRGQNEKFEENTPTAKKQRTNQARKSMG
ncbi:hypothetical protein BofuT4_P013450.1 [Botrytis cinerea T4]|uniref:Uncharacterized protein n=2 Tax=Botryotinia fuckeliana TaxID=40559 RepID=G2XR68_BOTF4|nr:hypothetical protein BofuT4_P013450.1 [Botrytis cinerea T4]